MSVSVIIPTYQEQANIGACLEGLRLCPGIHEILVCDGGSTDLTREIVSQFPEVRLEAAPRGRSSQMNHGARMASGDILWFVHADCAPPPGALTGIEQLLEDPGVVLGAFGFAVNSPRPVFRLLEIGVGVRSRFFRVPYGDQGLFCRREDFFRLGGYPEIEVMEDLYLVRKAKQLGRIEILDLDLPTSARRWQRRGFLQTSLRNWGLVIGDWIGVYSSPRCASTE